ncbi:MAG: hypothetical protein AAFU49_00450 [Pseudomonadota bacterium]
MAETRFRFFSTSLGIRGFGSFLCRSGFRYDYFGGFGSFDARPIARYEAFANSLVFGRTTPSDDPAANHARSVIGTLGPEIVRPEPAVNAGG